MFSIIKALEFLEVKYATGLIKGPEYHKLWNDLFHQAQMSVTSIPNFTTYENFINMYNL